MHEFIYVALAVVTLTIGLVGVRFVFAEIDKTMASNRLESLPSYELYSSASLIAESWNDYALVGVCERCGCDDAPIIPVNPQSFLYTAKRCKWCAELSSLTYHIQVKMQRS